MEIYPEIIEPVMERAGLHPSAKILVVRATQAVAIRLPRSAGTFLTRDRDQGELEIYHQ
jgi:hypothetical protein